MLFVTILTFAPVFYVIIRKTKMSTFANAFRLSLEASNIPPKEYQLRLLQAMIDITEKHKPGGKEYESTVKEYGKKIADALYQEKLDGVKRFKERWNL